MEKILITGFSGFVSRHFLQYLSENRIEAEIYGLDIREPAFDCSVYRDALTIRFRILDLLDMSALRGVFLEFVPDYILHLASFSSVAYSWRHPSESFSNNTNIFLNLLTAVKEFNRKCRVLSIGSSEEYGNVSPRDLPLTEHSPLRPVSPYAVARVSQEMLSRVFVESYHLDIILTRSFNHVGPWQDARFVVPSFISRALEVKHHSGGKGKIETGDISVIRDFVDVRDVVRAYYMLLKDGRSGEIYNVCSGQGRSLREILQIIAKKLDISITPCVNPDYLRPNDNHAVIGSAEKIRRELSWEPAHRLEDTLSDMIRQQEGDRLASP